MSKHRNTTIRIGHVWVDSGGIVMTDPCYLREWKGHDAAFDKPGEYSYAGFCTATCSDDAAGMLSEGMAAVVATGYGDGSYPVDVTYNNEGRVVAVTILFDEQPEDEQCDHCSNVVPADEMYDGLCGECQTLGDENEEDEED
jgi:hypothetical protein